MDPVKLKKETVEIEGGRKLYNYTFEIEDEPEENSGFETNSDEADST